MCARPFALLCIVYNTTASQEENHLAFKIRYIAEYLNRMSKPISFKQKGGATWDKPYINPRDQKELYTQDSKYAPQYVRRARPSLPE